MSASTKDGTAHAESVASHLAKLDAQQAATQQINAKHIEAHRARRAAHRGATDFSVEARKRQLEAKE